MARKPTTPRTEQAPAATVVMLRLYVAGGAPNSLKAVANLDAICRQHMRDGYKLEIVDVCVHPQRALDDGIVVTPSLSKLSPAPASSIIGNLSDTASVLAALGLRPGQAT